MMWMFVMFLVTAALVLGPGTGLAGRPIAITQRSTIAVLPVQVETSNFALADEIDFSVLQAFEEMKKFRVVTGSPVEEAANDLKIRLFPPSSQFSGAGGRHSAGRYRAPISSQVMDEENILKIGRRLKVEYAAGVTLHPREKTTFHPPWGRRLNGRCTIELIVVDVRRGEVLYEYPEPFSQPEEFGVAKQDDWKIAAGGLGLLAAGGIIGKGSTTRTFGWAALIASHTIKGGGGDQLQYDASVLAINRVFGDFYRRFQAQ